VTFGLTPTGPYCPEAESSLAIAFWLLYLRCHTSAWPF